MKQKTMLNIFSLLLIVLFAASCGSNRGFSSRKYTPGNYVSQKHKAGKVKVNETTKEETVHVSVEAAAEKDLVATKDIVKDEELLIDKKTLSDEPSSKGEQHSFLKNSKKQFDQFKEKYAFKRQIIKRDRSTQKGDDGGGVETTALVSFILSVVGVAINVTAITLIVSASEYIFTLLFIVGMVLGIIGLVFGTQGLRKHRKKGGTTIDLVFSIIGTALGGVAILTAFAFAFYTLIFWLMGM